MERRRTADYEEGASGVEGDFKEEFFDFAGVVLVAVVVGMDLFLLRDQHWVRKWK